MPVLDWTRGALLALLVLTECHRFSVRLHVLRETPR